MSTTNVLEMIETGCHPSVVSVWCECAVSQEEEHGSYWCSTTHSHSSGTTCLAFVAEAIYASISAACFISFSFMVWC